MAQDCLDHHFKTEDLEVHGECEQACCKRNQPTKKYLGMSCLPDTLVVVLKRYECVMFQQYDPVLRKQVDVPESMKVRRHAACFERSFPHEQSAIIGAVFAHSDKQHLPPWRACCTAFSFCLRSGGVSHLPYTSIQYYCR